MAAGPQHQPPEAACRQDPLKQLHPRRHLMLTAGGIGARHQHQLQADGGLGLQGPQGQITVQALR
jgi:hypothetical protein